MKITQKVLTAIMKQRAKLDQASAKLKAAEDKVFESLKAGASVEPGMLLAEVKRIERRNVAWRPAFEEQISKRDGEGAGKKLAERILAATQPSVYESLSVKLVK